MLKRDITYEDYDGEKITETFYFNLTKSEIIELEVAYDGGLQAAMLRIVKTNDRKNLVAEFKRIILLSYGKKSEDGKRFIKNDELREEFSQTAAFDALFMELATNDDAAAAFLKGVVPKEFSQEMDKVPVTPAVMPVLPKE
jgi:hypothetical protein